MSARKGSAFAGLSVAMVTPFRNGDIDYETLRQHVELQIEAGFDLSLPGGHDG